MEVSATINRGAFGFITVGELHGMGVKGGGKGDLSIYFYKKLPCASTKIKAGNLATREFEGSGKTIIKWTDRWSSGGRWVSCPF